MRMDDIRYATHLAAAVAEVLTTGLLMLPIESVTP
jgi:hypothetical protein